MKTSTVQGQTTCIIIDDELQTLNRLESLLMKFEGIKILAKESIPERGIEKVIELKPDIVFIDVEMPRMNGFAVIKAIREKNFSPTFIFVTAFNQYAIKAIKQAAFDYILKPVDIEELDETLKRYELSKFPVNSIMELPFLSCLCEREKEILKYVIKGHTSKEIAEKLFISKFTVDTYRKNILEKTDTHKISDLIIKALANQQQS
jgi:DNA-binding NarL/FixJ family response regulator